MIRHVVTRAGGAGDFIGHIAGDDFVFVTSADRVDAVCRGICERFDHLIRLYYERIDRERGFIETKDRFGVQRKFPVMASHRGDLAAARAVVRRARRARAVGKRTAKAIPGSAYVRDGDTMLVATART